MVRRALLALAAVPALYLAAALVGGVVPVNRNWSEPGEGITVYLRSNGIHVDLILPANAQGLDWRPLLPAADFASPPPGTRWFAFGAGERRVYLDTPRWRDIKPAAIWAGLAGGERVIHVERLATIGPGVRAVRLRPAEYRRLWASVRSEFALGRSGRPQRVDHPGYWTGDAFYEGRGKASAVNTCNQWVADRLRTAGVTSSIWSPFTPGLTWRYRKVDQST